MPGRKVLYFTEKEEEFTNLLITVGLPRIVAKVLVFLANTREASSRDIERGADLRQPEGEPRDALSPCTGLDRKTGRTRRKRSAGLRTSFLSPGRSPRSSATSRKKKRARSGEKSPWRRRSALTWPRFFYRIS